MDIDIGTYSIWKRSADLTPEQVTKAESLGYGAVWAGGSPPGDLEHVERLIAARDHIPVLTGIVNMWRDDADTVAASFHRIERQHPGRFVLGVGIGHREAIDEYANPYDKMVDYVAELVEAGVPKRRIVLAALGPRALRLAAAETAGTHPYFTTPRHTRTARQTIGDGPLLAPEQTVVIDSDRSRGIATARDFTARYLRLENYRNSLLREGWSPGDLEDGGSDDLVSEVVLIGEAPDVAARLHSHLDAGADHVAIQILGDEDLSLFAELAPYLDFG